MNLILTIKKSPAGVSLDQAQYSFDEAGGDIGRADYNTWILKDPERFISSRHCSIQFEEGVYYLVDCSTNGTFLNNASEPIGNGERSALSDGMSFSVGDYEFAVKLGAGMESSPASSPNDGAIPGVSGPFSAGSHSAAPANNVAPIDNQDRDDTGFADDLLLSGDSSLYEPIRITPHEESIIPGQENVLDPLRAFDELNRKKNPELSLDGHEYDPGNQADHAPLADQAFSPPKLTGSEMIPDDWDSTEYGFHAESKHARNKKSKGNPSKKASVDSDFDFELEDLGADDDLAVVANKSKAKPKLADNAVKQQQLRQQQLKQQQLKQQQAKQQQAKRQQVKQQPVKERAVKSKRPANVAAAAQAVDNNLLSAIGLDKNDFSQEQLAQLNHVVGHFVRHTVEGLLKVLRARSTIKNELRLGMTTVQPRDNNPIKFSADVDDALEHLFVRQGKAYMPPIASVNESFETILDHQVAVLAGMRAAFKSLIEKFDPMELARKFEAQSGSGLFSGSKKQRHWEAYSEFYSGQVQDLDSSFQHLFGEEFVKAYESQLVQLSIARKQESADSE